MANIETHGHIYNWKLDKLHTQHQQLTRESSEDAQLESRMDEVWMDQG